MSAHPEWFTAFLARAPVRVICPDRYGQNPACRHCVGGYVTRHPYAEGSGEQGLSWEEMATLRRHDVTFTAPPPEPLYPRHATSPARLRELARVCRDEANSAPLRELLDCIEAGHG